MILIIVRHYVILTLKFQRALYGGVAQLSHYFLLFNCLLLSIILNIFEPTDFSVFSDFLTDTLESLEDVLLILLVDDSPPPFCKPINLFFKFSDPLLSP